jgi:hypothetical protein
MKAPALELRLPPRWDALPSAWEPCRKTLRDAGLRDDDVYSLCMVAQELLENAVKYGEFEDDGDAVGLAIGVTGEEVTIEVRNRVSSEPGRLRKFDQAVQWIRGFQDPFEAYVEKMKSASAHHYAEGKSGLGLARMAYEGRCIVDFYLDEQELAVSAVYARPQEQGG